MKNHTLRDRGENWKEEFDKKWDDRDTNNGFFTINFNYKILDAEKVKDFISTLRSDLLQQVIEGLPTECFHSSQCGYLGDGIGQIGYCTCGADGFNKCRDQVTSLLNKMRDEN